MSGLRYDVQHQLTFYQFLSPEARLTPKSVQAAAALKTFILAQCSSNSYIFTVRHILMSMTYYTPIYSRHDPSRPTLRLPSTCS